MFVGEGPGHHEDVQGVPFVGAAGQLLNRLLAGIGLRREEVYITNVVLCRPPNNRDPLPDEIEACSGYLMEQVAAVDPRVIVTLGNFATRVILGRQVGISRIRGTRETWSGRTVVPMFHPAAALRSGGERSPTHQALVNDFALVRRILDETPPEPPSPAPVSVGAQEQLGLF